MTESLFIRATRQKLRIASTKGLLSVEDLWDLPLSSLNTIAKGLNKNVKEADEEDFLAEENEQDIELKLQFDTVLYILQTKKREKEAAQKAAETRAKKAKLVDALARKQDAALETMSEEDLKKAIDEL